MRRQRKHRHHPDIWRERHVEGRRQRQWYARMTSRALAYRAAGGHVLIAADFLAAVRDIWDDCAPLVTVAHVGPEALIITGINPLRVGPPS